MKKITLFIIVSLMLPVIQSKSQTADDIIEKYTEAIGGIDNIKSVKTLIMTGTVAVHGMELPLTITFKRPGKVRIDVEFQGMKQVQAYDGKTAWQIEFMKSKVEKMSESQAENMKVTGDFEGALIDYKRKGYTAALLGKENVDSTETYKVALIKAAGDSLFYNIDAKTFLVTKRTKLNKSNVLFETYNKSFKTFSGLVLPVSMEIKQGEDEEALQKVTFDKVEVNPDIDNAIFKMPTDKN